MSVERLREAAALLRERAEAATSGPWDCWTAADDRREVFVPDGTMSAETVMEFKDFADCEECARTSEADTFYLATMHPGVGLALADALDHASKGWICDNVNPTDRRLIAVADQILGSDS